LQAYLLAGEFELDALGRLPHPQRDANPLLNVTQLGAIAESHHPSE
jgi:hypothetical protein